MEPERLDDKLLIRKCPNGFARFKTRPPLLSSATRLQRAKLAGANVQPPYGLITFFIFILADSFFNSRPRLQKHSRWLGARFTLSP